MGKSKNIYRLQLMFRNKNHEVYTVKVNKIALNRDSDKRVVQRDGVGVSILRILMSYLSGEVKCHD